MRHTLIKSLKVFMALLVATTITTLVSSIVQTQNTIGHLKDMGLPIDMGTHLSTVGSDIVGMGPAFGAIILIALGVGFLVAFGLLRLGVPLSPHFAYPLAAFCAVIVTFVLMRLVMEMTPISSARTSVGLILHGLAGFIGGRFFARMMSMRPQVTASETQEASPTL